MRAASSAAKPSDCWDWLAVEDVARIAKTALRLARDSCYPPKGEPWRDSAVPWSDPRTFTDTFVRLLVLHVEEEAHVAGIKGYEHASREIRRYRVSRNVARGFVAMGHGCPASLAGGPGRGIGLVVEASSSPADALHSPENRS